jgi:hypothetical protein
MASWIVHLRVADALLDRIPGLDAEKFVVGNIGPDCGAVTAVRGEYDPPNTITHYSPGGKKRDCEPWRFRAEYLPDPDPVRQSFYLGYYVHLLTDRLWHEHVFVKAEQAHAAEFAADPELKFVMKKDWYDLDAKYLRDHPGFRAFEILCNVQAFPNTYLPFYSETAIFDQVRNIPRFYASVDSDLDRDYPFLTEAAMDAFLDLAVAEIGDILREDGLITE